MEENQPLVGDDNNVSYGTEAIKINTSKSGKYSNVAFVLITETLERLAFYGLLCNMVLSLNSDPLLWSSYNAAHAAMIFTGLSYIITIFGGWIADSYLGKFWTVIIFFVLYFAVMWCDSGFYNRTEPVPLYRETCSATIFLTLSLIAVGYGCVRVNIVPFGAQQVEDHGQNTLRVYFNWLYWCINVGSFVGFGVFGFIQQDISYFYGYIGPTIALFLAWVTFIAGSYSYKKKSYLGGSPLKSIFKVLCSSIRICCKRTWQCIKQKRRMSDGISCLERTSVANGGHCPVEIVDNTKAFLKVLLIFLCLIPYWMTFYQTQTTFLIQGMHMRLNFPNQTDTDGFSDQSFKIPISWLSLFNIMFVILIVPLLDRVLYPWLDSLSFNITIRFRVLFGMIFSMIAMLVAGYVERVRLKNYWGEDNLGHPHIQFIACTKYYAADMCILWQIPQYLLIALSEVFTSIAGLEMAYVCAPKSFQSLIIGFYYCAQGLGSIFGTLVMLSLQRVWFYHYDYGNINCERSPFLPDSHLHPESSCHLDYYFCVMAGVQVFGMIAFALVAYLMDIGGPRPARIQRSSQRHS